MNLSVRGQSDGMLTIHNLNRQGLEPIDLTLDNGECMAVMGPSGSGKSLFLRAIADLDSNDGEVILDDVERSSIPAPQWRRQVSYVPAEPGWWADDVGSHFADKAAAAELTREMQFPDDVFSWPVERLSTGERQRLGLARALALQPRCLLLDEPTSGLDEETGARVEALIADRLASGTIALMVTHDFAQAMRFARRVLRLDAGKFEVGDL